jgi:glycosyltransferase involved in cell wall biosynthesis
MTRAAKMEGDLPATRRAGDPGAQGAGVGAVVTVIIATLAEAVRAEQLLRAVRSARHGNDQEIEVLVVVNGDRYDEELVRQLSVSHECRLVRLDEASLPRALCHGVDISSSPYFSFLDDDDEYLPGAVDLRLRTMEAHPDAALLVTSGYRRKGGVDHPVTTELSRVAADPLLALFRENWLPSCGGLFRRSAIPREVFLDVPPLLEWTWIAFGVSEAGGKVVVLDEPTFVINDTDGSQSASMAYTTSLPGTLSLLRARATRPDVRSAVNRHLVRSFYAASSLCLSQRRMKDAWRFHVLCLQHRGGWRYWKHTLRLFGLQRPKWRD